MGIWEGNVVEISLLFPQTSSMLHTLLLPISGRFSADLVPLCNKAMFFGPNCTQTPNFHAPGASWIALGTSSVGRIFHNPKGCSFSAEPKENPMKSHHVSALISISKIAFSYLFIVQFQSLNQSLMGQNLQIARISAQSF